MLDGGWTSEPRVGRFGHGPLADDAVWTDWASKLSVDTDDRILRPATDVCSDSDRSAISRVIKFPGVDAELIAEVDAKTDAVSLAFWKKKWIDYEKWWFITYF